MNVIDYINKVEQQIIITDSRNLNITIPSKGDERDVDVHINNPLLLPVKYNDNYSFRSDYIITDDEVTITGNARNNTENILDIFSDNSCKALYKFNDNANDESGNYNGTWEGNELYTECKFDNGAFLDGNSYVSINSGQTNETAISFWFKSTQDGFQCLFSQKDNIIGTHSFGVYRYADNIKAFVRDINDDWKTLGSIDANNNEWYHIVAMKNSTTQKVYVNGKLVFDTQIDTYDDFSELIYIGKFIKTDSYNAKNIYIDQFRVFDRMLTDEEINILMEE